MHGDKWKILVETIHDLLDLLEDFDRLSIVSFDSSAERECKLIRMNEKGKLIVKELMKKCGPRGSTNITSGMTYALKILNDRKYKNPVSSIFLLGDG